MRIGHGFDIHALAPGRKLILAGVEVPSEAGCVGHSDADVVAHALADALLGALSLGDIGEWFPDSDPQWKDADSTRLLAVVVDAIRKRGAAIVNADVTIYLEKPKLGALKGEMRARLAQVLGIDGLRVGLKARTFERFGAIGNGEAAAATAVVLLDDGQEAGG